MDDILNNVTTIGDYAFYGNDNWSLTIPVSVTSIGTGAFASFYSLDDVYYGGTETQWNAITIGTDNDPLLNAAIHYSDGTSGGTCGDNIKWVLDNNGVLTISGTGAMMDYSYFSDVPWHSSYNYNYNITSVIIKDGITSIGNYAFYECDGLTSVTIPDSVTSIGRYAFYNCTSLTGVTIPDSVTSIRDSAFRNCTSLTDVYYGVTETQWNAISIDNAYNGNDPLLNATIHYNSTPPVNPDDNDDNHNDNDDNHNDNDENTDPVIPPVPPIDDPPIMPNTGIADYTTVYAVIFVCAAGCMLISYRKRKALDDESDA